MYKDFNIVHVNNSGCQETSKYKLKKEVNKFEIDLSELCMYINFTIVDNKNEIAYN